MCDHRLWSEPDGLRCSRLDAHDPDARGGHEYRASVGADNDGGHRHADCEEAG